MRKPFICKKLSLISFALLGLGKIALAHDVGLVPATNQYPDSQKAMDIYAANPKWQLEVIKTQHKGQPIPKALRIQVPSPFSCKNLISNSVLPTLPQSSIYRFKYLTPTEADKRLTPFQLLEVDWNTEGQPRGPNGSFITPHYDFHFYSKSSHFVDNDMNCVSSGKTCDSMKTPYPQMRQFLKVPLGDFVPKGTFTDNDSSITAMGIHNLDGTFNYTVENVNHNPIIIYGSFNGEIAFLEASITLYGFEDAVKQAKLGKKSSWPIHQPLAFAYDWWPETITLEYKAKQDVFYLELTDFKQHPVTPYHPQKI